MALHRLDEIHEWQGLTEQGIEIRRRGVRILHDLVKKYPNNLEYRYDDFYHNLQLGIYNLKFGRASEVRRCLTLAGKELTGKEIESLLALEPGNAIY